MTMLLWLVVDSELRALEQLGMLSPAWRLAAIVLAATAEPWALLLAAGLLVMEALTR